MQPIEIRRSTRAALHKLLWEVLVGVGCVSWLYGSGWEVAAYVVGLLITLFIVVRSYAERDVVVVVDDQGVMDRRLGVATLPWSAISGVRKESGGLFLELRDPGALGIRRTLWHRLRQPLGGRKGSLNVFIGLAGLDRSADELMPLFIERVYGR